MTADTREVFISYAWGGESEALVDRIEAALTSRGFHLARDKKVLEYKGSIGEFEKRIGAGQCVILVVSDRYLKSIHCMRELVEAAAHKELQRRIVPVVLGDAHIHRAEQRLDYLHHWENEKNILQDKLRRGDLAHLEGLTDDLNLMDDIRRAISGLTSTLADMNTLTPELLSGNDFARLVEAVEKSLAASPPAAGAFYVEALPADYVQRPIEHEAIIENLLAGESGEAAASGATVGLTTAVRGAGGFGKTLLARAVCHDPRVRAAFPGGILWVTLGEQPPSITDKLAGLVEQATGERAGFSDAEAAGKALHAALLDRKCLVVIDDVWRTGDLPPFLQGGAACRHLVTTRFDNTLPAAARRVPVDAMRAGEAAQLLTGQAAVAPQVRALIARLGEWPLLLSLAGAFLRPRLEAGEPLDDAAAFLLEALEAEGLTVFDDSEGGRARAVAVTLGVQLGRLAESERQRLFDLAVFPEDEHIPLDAVAHLWAGLGRFAVERLLQVLAGQSLLHTWNLRERWISLHDVIRQYLVEHTPAPALKALHKRLWENYQSASPQGPAAVPDDGHYYQYAPYHLKEAGESEALRGLLLNLDWMQKKLAVCGVNALTGDYRLAPGLGSVGDALRKSAHVPLGEAGQLPAQLLGRLHGAPGCEPLLAACRAWRGAPWLRPQSGGLTPPGDPLIGTLAGHTGGVYGVLLLPGGRALSWSEDKTLRLWDLESSRPGPVLEGHTDMVRGALLLPDGRRALSWSHDRTLRLWDLESGTPGPLLRGHTGLVYAALLLPDGRALSWSHDGTLRLWVLENGEPGAASTRGTVLAGHRGPVFGVLLLPDGRALSWSEDKTLRLWDLESGRQAAVLAGHTDRITGALLLPDGRALSWSEDSTLRLWDLESGRQAAVLKGHTDRITGALHLPDGRALSWSKEGTLRSWDLKSGRSGTASTQGRVLEGHDHRVDGVMLLPDGRALSWSHDGTLREWDLESGTPGPVMPGDGDFVDGVALLPGGQVVSWGWGSSLLLRDLENLQPGRAFKGHTGRVRGVHVLSGGRALSWSDDHTLRLWDLETSRTGPAAVPGPVLESHTGGVMGALLMPEGQALSWGQDGVLRLWDLESGKPGPASTQVSVLVGHESWVLGVLRLPDGRILSWSVDYTLRVWDVEASTPGPVLKGHTGTVEGALLLPDGRILSWSIDHTLRVWDVEASTPGPVLKGHTSTVLGAMLLPDGRILSWSEDHTLRVWNLKTGRADIVLKGHKDRVRGALLLPGGQALSWSSDGNLIIWDLESSDPGIFLAGHTDSVRGALLLPDGRALSWSGDSDLILWNLETGEPGPVLEGHDNWVLGALLLPDGRALSWSEDGTLRLWDLDSGSPGPVLAGHTAEVMGAMLLPGGKALSWGRDSTLRLWDLDSGRQVHVFYADFPVGVCLWAPELRRFLVGDQTGRVYPLNLIE